MIKNCSFKNLFWIICIFYHNERQNLLEREILKFLEILVDKCRFLEYTYAYN